MVQPDAQLALARQPRPALHRHADLGVALQLVLALQVHIMAQLPKRQQQPHEGRVVLDGGQRECPRAGGLGAMTRESGR